jgi:hypothetical protein
MVTGRITSGPGYKLTLKNTIMITEKLITEMDDGKDKELLKLLQGNEKPFMRKADGYAVKCEEDKEIKYKDHNDNELTLTVPKGSYICIDVDSHYPKIVTAEDFEKKNKFLEGPKKKENPKKEDKFAIGIEAMDY